jgi:hypothetical protein
VTRCVAWMQGKQVEFSDTLAGMDPVRFGRVLGIGTRLAGRTVADALDAAATPNPRAAGSGERTPAATRQNNPPQTAPRQDRPAGVVLPPAGAARRGYKAANVAQGARRFRDAMWKPFARASGVLWLEVTGVFFGLIALFGLQGMWTNRAAWATSASNHTAHQHLLVETALALIFGYFCISSFVRAARRGRRP